ncbi:MAG: DUF924 family protein [Alphaproteobacteria bacterium]
MKGNRLSPSWANEVFEFWFSELGPEAWFSARPEVDDLIGERFGALHAMLASAPPAAETLDAKAHVSIVIVFDQFSRNLFRKSPRAFATDPLALAFANDAIESGMHRGLTVPERQFLYMPFMHSEDRGDQARSLALFAGLERPDLLGYAEQHEAIVARFGRFPHRNAALGRESTPEERQFLATSTPFA